MRRALREELRWRDDVIRSLHQPSPASDFVRKLEGQGRPVSRESFVNALLTGVRSNLSQDEFVASISPGSQPAAAVAPRLRRGMSLSAELAARDAAVAAVQSQQRQPTTAKLRAGMPLDVELALRERVLAALPEGHVGARSRMHRPPTGRRERLIRGCMTGGGAPALTIRSATRSASTSDSPVLDGYGATFGQWTEIDSLWEGNFMERIAPGAFKKTLQERASSIRCLFQHGRDPVVGDKPLGPFETLEEDDTGLHYVVPLLDTQYCNEIAPGLRAGVYGSSFMFDCIRDEMDQNPGVSSFNPSGIPQRTLLELRLFETGPVSFPAYQAATAGLRGNFSLTDLFANAEAA